MLDRYESAFHETAKESSVYCWCDKKKGFTHCEGPQCVYDVNWGSAAHQQNHTGFPFSCKHVCGDSRGDLPDLQPCDQFVRVL